jgi:putative flippase GtrA
MNFKKIIKFQLVAWLGTIVNLGSLWILHGILKIPVTIAGACAIELAILHNFTWYYFRTWNGRVAHTPTDFFLKTLEIQCYYSRSGFCFQFGYIIGAYPFFSSSLYFS